MKYVFIIPVFSITLLCSAQNPDSVASLHTVFVPSVGITEPTYLLPYAERAYTFRELIIRYPHPGDSSLFKINFPRMKFPGIPSDLNLDSLRIGVSRSNSLRMDTIGIEEPNRQPGREPLEEKDVIEKTDSVPRDSVPK